MCVKLSLIRSVKFTLKNLPTWKHVFVHVTHLLYADSVKILLYMLLGLFSRCGKKKYQVRLGAPSGKKPLNCTVQSLATLSFGSNSQFDKPAFWNGPLFFQLINASPCNDSFQSQLLAQRCKNLEFWKYFLPFGHTEERRCENKKLQR